MAHGFIVKHFQIIGIFSFCSLRTIVQWYKNEQKSKDKDNEFGVQSKADFDEDSDLEIVIEEALPKKKHPCAFL